MVRLESFLARAAVATDSGTPSSPARTRRRSWCCSRTPRLSSASSSRRSRLSCSWKLKLPWIDGAGSILIGLVLAVVAVLLARESKELLIGERASPELARRSGRPRREDPCVRKVIDITTSQMGPDQVIATISVEIDEDLRVPAGRATDRPHRASRSKPAFPQLFRIFIRPVAGARLAGRMASPALDAGGLTFVRCRPEQIPGSSVLLFR